MRIKMRSTRLGSPDGIQVNSYQAGETYEVPDQLGQVFLDEGWAARPQAKAKTKAPANKNAGAAPRNKGAPAGAAKPSDKAEV